MGARSALLRREACTRRRFRIRPGGEGVAVLRFGDLAAMRAGVGAPPFLAIGTFDGLHRGHRAVIRCMLAQARQAGVPAVALTFTPHPVAVLRPGQAPPLLADYDERAARIAETGVDALVELPFTRALAAVKPAAFVETYLCGRAEARRVFVGADFTFGAGGAGTPEGLAVLGRQACGMATMVVPLLHNGGAPISSTRIRQALRDGKPGLAARLLGRPFTMDGTVVEGDRRGRTIGFPTANLLPRAEMVLPALGVYAVRVGIDGAPPMLPAVANLGHRPTVGGAQLRLEVHLLEYEGDLYGRRLTVALIRRLRGERRFANVAALRQQIGRDAARAAALLN